MELSWKAAQLYASQCQANTLLNKTFESIIDLFLDKKVGMSNDFLDWELSQDLQKNLLRLLNNEQLKEAGIGAASNLKHNKKIRSDKIYWLDRKHENIFENRFLDLIDEFVLYLNRSCYTGIVGYEFHYALYQKGSFYKRHLDQFKDNNKRAFSMIVYLNNDWQTNDGGELCIYHDDHTQIVSPDNQKCVFFRSSELEHEVLTTTKPRLSITGWLKTN